MIHPVKPIELGLPPYSVTSPYYQSDYQIDGSATERGATGTATIIPISSGAFYGIYLNDAGDTYLVGGQVMGGTGNFIEDDIKIIDSNTGPVRSAGTNMILGVTGDGYVVDGVLFAGFDISASSIAYTSIPSNTVPTATSFSGKKCYINLGVFTGEGFQPASSGNIRVSFCPSSYSISRF